MTAGRPQRVVRLTNEFAAVTVEVIEQAGGDLLRVRDPKSGNTVDLDPLELEALTRLSFADRAVLVDPTSPGRPLDPYSFPADRRKGA